MRQHASKASRIITNCLSIQLGATETTLLVKRHPRARRASLRISADGQGIIAVLPARGRLDDAVAMARQHADWIRGRLQALPKRVRFADGAVLPVQGRQLRIRHLGAMGVKVRDNGEQLVGGAQPTTYRDASKRGCAERRAGC